MRTTLTIATPFTSNQVPSPEDGPAGSPPKGPTGAEGPVGFTLPEGVAVPWQLRTGVSYRWGQRRFNQPFRILKKTKKKPPKPPPTKKKAGSSIKPKPEPKHTGEYFVLVSAELVMTGAVKDAVGTDGFLDQIQERAGQRITVSARLGVEAEV